MTDRERLTVPEPAGGWAPPWPQVAEIADALGPEHWTLVGGLMVQLHATAAGIAGLRPTADVDMLIHVETGTGRAATVAAALEELGYAFEPSIDPRSRFAHRFRRGSTSVDVAVDVVDVVTADHVPPSRVERLRGYDMAGIEGGTQALRRTLDATLTIAGREVTVSVPNTYGALLLKSAAHQVDSRDRERHLTDAATLLACIEDPFAIRDLPASGSDSRRLRHLANHLDDPAAPAWLLLLRMEQRRGLAALRILTQRLPTG